MISQIGVLYYAYMTRSKDEKFAKETGDKFRNAREKLGLTQEDVAEKADINITTYARIERGEIVTSGSNLIKISKILKVKL